jgi:hypothetical protein
MIKILTLTALVALAGCSTAVPIVQKFPEPTSQELMQSCPALKEAQTNTEKLTDLMSVVADNYKEYHLCRDRVNDWISWYNKQKENFGTVKQ